jgi:hypothetical protein
MSQSIESGMTWQQGFPRLYIHQVARRKGLSIDSLVGDRPQWTDDFPSTQATDMFMVVGGLLKKQIPSPGTCSTQTSRRNFKKCSNIRELA